MRIGTSQIYFQSVEAFQQQQVKLLKLQQQISSGVRLTKPSDDPLASAQVLEMEQVVSLKLQYQVNIGIAENRLELEETALAGVENLIFRMRELAIQANNGANDATAMQAIGVEMEEINEALLSLANTQDTNGDYLFAGFQNQQQPFTEVITGSIRHVIYNGDQGQRSLQISETRQVAVDDPGREVFMEIPSATALNELAAPANAGTGVMAPAHVFDASLYTPGTFEIRFTGPATYDVFDVGLGANIVTGATYTDSANIDFQGIRTSITGVPAAGDVFTISPGQYRDIFESVLGLSESLQSAPGGAARSANVGEFLDDLDNFLTRVLDIRSKVGGRLNALENQFDVNEAHINATKSSLSALRDTDLAEAISQLTLEQTTLDAAQAIFARITSSSLFNFLR